jgi:hypothetical protein
MLGIYDQDEGHLGGSSPALFCVYGIPEESKKSQRGV